MESLKKEERLQMMFAELKSRGLVKKQKDLAEKIGAATSTVSAALHGGPNSTDSILARVSAAFEGIFNPSWVNSGIGPMLANDAPPTYGYVTNNGDVSGQNFGSGTQIVTPQADNQELQKLRERIHELEIENAKLQGMIEILKQK